MAYFRFDLTGPNGEVIQEIECEIQYTGHLCRIDGFSFEIDAIRTWEFNGPGVELYEESPCEHVATLATWIKAQAENSKTFRDTVHAEFWDEHPKEVAAYIKAAA